MYHTSLLNATHRPSTRLPILKCTNTVSWCDADWNLNRRVTTMVCLKATAHSGFASNLRVAISQRASETFEASSILSLFLGLCSSSSLASTAASSRCSRSSHRSSHGSNMASPISTDPGCDPSLYGLRHPRQLRSNRGDAILINLFLSRVQ